MASLQKSMAVYKEQVKKGDIKKAYIGLMDFIKSLKSGLEDQHPDYQMSSGIHEGTMDYTYFHFSTPSLATRKLKIVILFTHDTFTFEVLLSGVNRNVQENFWKLFAKRSWSIYRLSDSPKNEDFIVHHVLAENPEFSDSEALSSQLIYGIDNFVEEIETFLKQFSQ